MNAQNDFRKGYIISLKSDTAWGLIDVHNDFSSSHSCTFKKDSESPQQIYKPKEIASYRFINGKYYIAKTFRFKNTDTTLFVEYLVEGIANLYYFKDKSSEEIKIGSSYKNSGDYYIFEKSRNKPVLLTNTEYTTFFKDQGTYQGMRNEYVGLLIAQTSDSPETKRLIENAGFNQKSLINIATKYHESVCKDRTCIVYAKKIPSLKFKWGPAISFVFTDAKYQQMDMELTKDADKSSYPTLGLQFEINNPSISEHLSLQLSSNIGKHSLNYYYHINSQYNPSVVSLNYLFFKQHIGFVYKLDEIKNFRPKFYGGFIYNHSFHDKSTDFNLGQVKILDPENSAFVPKSMMGFAAGIGVDYHLPNHMSIFLTVNYEYNFGTLDAPNHIVNWSSISLNTGFYF